MERLHEFVSSIRFRMLALYLFITLAALVTIIITVSYVVETSLVMSKITARQNLISKTAVELAEPVASNDSKAVYEIMHTFAQDNDARLLILDTNYVVMLDSASLYNGYFLPYDEARDVIEKQVTEAYGLHLVDNTRESGSEWVVYMAQPLTNGGKSIGVIMCSGEIQSAYEGVTEVQRRIAEVFVIVISAVFVASLILSRYLSKPIIDLTKIIRNTSPTHYPENIEINGVGEIAELVDAFNAMSKELITYDKARDDFVANASHELKTPLTSIKVLSESLTTMDNPDPRMMLEFLNDINSEVDRLNSIISDLLELTKNTSGKVVLKPERLNLAGLAQQVAVRLKPIAEKRNIDMRFSAETDVPIIADKTRFDRVITNLIDNAVKYTEKGYVSIVVKTEMNNAVLAVSDSGVGIPADALPRLFERFYRVDKARSRATGGTGLGLSLVKEIVESFGGKISVTSTMGKGSTFTVTIPLAGKDTPLQQ